MRASAQRLSERYLFRTQFVYLHIYLQMSSVHTTYLHSKPFLRDMTWRTWNVLFQARCLCIKIYSALKILSRIVRNPFVRMYSRDALSVKKENSNNRQVQQISRRPPGRSRHLLNIFIIPLYLWDVCVACGPCNFQFKVNKQLMRKSR